MMPTPIYSRLNLISFFYASLNSTVNSHLKT